MNKKVSLFVVSLLLLSPVFGGIYNETTMPRNTAEQGIYVSVAVIIIVFAFLLIMAIKQTFETTIKLIKGK